MERYREWRNGHAAERLAFKTMGESDDESDAVQDEFGCGRMVQRVIPISRAWTSGRDLRPIESQSFHEFVEDEVVA